MQGAFVRHDGKMVDTRLYPNSAVTTAVMCLYVAELANQRYGWGREQNFSEPVARFNAYLSAMKSPPLPDAYRLVEDDRPS